MIRNLLLSATLVAGLSYAMPPAVAGESATTDRSTDPPEGTVPSLDWLDISGVAPQILIE